MLVQGVTFCYSLLSNQFGRRNLPIFVRAELALKAKKEIAKKAKELGYENREKNKASCPNSDKIKPNDTKKVIAKQAQVGHDTINKVERILDEKSGVSEETKAQLRRGEVSVNAAFKEVRKKELREKRVEKIQEISKGNTELKSDKKYPVIYADPPWLYRRQWPVIHSIAPFRGFVFSPDIKKPLPA